MGSTMAPINLTLNDLERSNSRSPKFRRLISRKGAELGPMLLLNINRKSYMWSPISLSNLTLSALNAQRLAYGFIPHNNCPMCNNYPEDTMHFFLRCPALAAPRVALLAGVNDILSHISNQFVADSIKNSSSDLHSLLLRGSELLPLQINTRIFELVHSYIGLSSRFSN